MADGGERRSYEAGGGEPRRTALVTERPGITLATALTSISGGNRRNLAGFELSIPPHGIPGHLPAGAFHSPRIVETEMGLSTAPQLESGGVQLVSLPLLHERRPRCGKTALTSRANIDAHVIAPLNMVGYARLSSVGKGKTSTNK